MPICLCHHRPVRGSVCGSSSRPPPGSSCAVQRAGWPRQGCCGCPHAEAGRARSGGGAHAVWRIAGAPASGQAAGALPLLQQHQQHLPTPQQVMAAAVVPVAEQDVCWRVVHACARVRACVRACGAVQWWEEWACLAGRTGRLGRQGASEWAMVVRLLCRREL